MRTDQRRQKARTSVLFPTNYKLAALKSFFSKPFHLEVVLNRIQELKYKLLKTPIYVSKVL